MTGVILGVSEGTLMKFLEFTSTTGRSGSYWNRDGRKDQCRRSSRGSRATGWLRQESTEIDVGAKGRGTRNEYERNDEFYERKVKRDCFTEQNVKSEICSEKIERFNFIRRT